MFDSLLNFMFRGEHKMEKMEIDNKTDGTNEQTDYDVVEEVTPTGT